MTDKDRELIKQAEQVSRWHYQDIDALIEQADTEEAKARLWSERQLLRDLMYESL